MKVPQYETQVRPTGYSNPGTPRVIDTTAGFRKGLSNLAADVQDSEQRTAELEAEQSLQEYTRAANDLLLKGKDAYFRKQGKDSVDGAKPTLDALEDLKRQHLDNIKNPRAQALLKKSLEARFTSDKARIQAHALKGQDEWDVSLAKAGIEQTSEEISLYINDPKKVQAGEFAIREHLQTVMRGMPQETINEEVQNAMSAAIASGIQAEMITNPVGAQRMLEQYAGKLEPEHLLKIKAQLKTRVDKQKASDAAMSLQSKYPGDIRAQRAAAKKMFKNNADVLDDVDRRLVNEYNMNRTLEKIAKEETYQRLGDDIMIRGIPYDQLAVTEADAIESLDISQQKNLMALESQIAKQEPVKHDPVAWTEIMEMSDQEIMDVHPLDYVLKLDAKHYDKLLNMKKDLRNKKPEERTYVQTIHQKINMALDHLKDNPQAKLGAYSDIQTLVEQVEEFKKKKDPVNWHVTDDELHHIVDTYFMNRPFKNYNIYESTENSSIANLTIDNVPDEWRAATYRALISQGVSNPDDDFVRSEALRTYRIQMMKEAMVRDKLAATTSLLREFIEAQNQ